MSSSSVHSFSDYEAAVERAKKEILAALPKPDSTFWKLATLVLPIVLTSGLGLLVYNFPTRMESYLQTRLSLTQDYYRERLRIMQAVHSPLIGLQERVNAAANSSATDAKLEDPIAALQKSYAESSIFLSRTLLERLGALWQQSVAQLRQDRIDDKELEQFNAAVLEVENQMRRDLLIDGDNLLPPGQRP
jgi:hypothetical protein